MKKKLLILGLTVAMSLCLPLISHADQWERQADGSYKNWYEEENLNKDSGFYNVHNYKWEQQADGTWKVYHTHDYWKTLCSCAFGHRSDPKRTCPGRLEHKEEWLTGRHVINGISYMFDENGIMVTNQWIPYLSNQNSKEKYSDAIYVYYDESGAKLYDTVVDGRYIDTVGYWYDPSIIPIGSDGRFDLAKIDWTSEIPYLIQNKILSDFTKEEITNTFKALPEYVGETANQYGYVEAHFTNYQIESNFRSIKIMIEVGEYNGQVGTYYNSIRQ